jgi:glycosyltransferase involved in cell wall biosynthesis
VGDPAALAAAIRALLGEDAGRRRARKEAARRRAVEKFGLSRMVAAFDALYLGET